MAVLASLCIIENELKNIKIRLARSGGGDLAGVLRGTLAEVKVEGDVVAMERRNGAEVEKESAEGEDEGREERRAAGTIGSVKQPEREVTKEGENAKATASKRGESRSRSLCSKSKNDLEEWERDYCIDVKDGAAAAQQQLQLQ